jgi:hypothetical protein
MKRKINLTVKAQLLRSAFLLLRLVAVCVIPFALAQWQIGGPAKKENPTGAACTPGWSAGPDMPSTGVRMVGIYFYPNGKFYAIGERSMDGVGNDFTHPFEYDPTSNTWTIKSATFPDNQGHRQVARVRGERGRVSDS